MTEHKKVGAFGTPCGGTTYINALLQKAGLKVKKEKIGEDGTVCGFFIWGLRGGEPDKYTFEHTIHYMRHPLSVARTLPKYVPHECHEWPWVLVNAPVLSALRYWVLTHEKLYSVPLKLRIGPQFPEDWGKVAKVLHLSPEVPEAEKSQYGHKGWKNYRVPSWDEWRKEDPEFSKRGEHIVNYYELEYI